MIRNAASALLRRSTASAASLSRATPAHQMVVPHPLQPQSPALSAARGFHAAATKSGQRRAADTTLLPARRHGHSAAKNTMENSSSIEEKKAALLQVLFKEEATAATCKRNQQEIDMEGLKAEKELKEEMEALSVARKAKTEDLLAMIGRQGASGVDQETLVLARLAQAGQDIQDVKQNMTYLQFYLAVLGVATGYLSLLAIKKT